ncbi:MAG: CPBP family glutamic-type intramembrane protease [Planctomycetes bacterium]|nr:CPBP family glutamic-type intramembrane protease [Planctomycetota bacterium]
MGEGEHGADDPACGPWEAFGLLVLGLVIAGVAARLDRNPGTFVGAVQPVVMFLGWIGPAYALAARRGRDPLVAHRVLVPVDGRLPATLVSTALLALFVAGWAGWARWSGVPAAGDPGDVTRAAIEWLLWGTLFVALPEEYFFRGVLQPALDRPGVRTVRVLGADLGRGALLGALAFGASHVLLDLVTTGATSPLRAATVFPALWFAWLRARTGSVVPAALAHGVANAVLVACRDLFDAP